MTVPTLTTGTPNSGVNNVVYTLPSHVAGEIVGVAIETAESGGVTAPSGWAHVTNSPKAQGSNVTALSVIWKRATSNSETNPNVADPGNHQVGIPFKISGAVSSGNFWNFAPVVDGQSGVTSFSADQGTTTLLDCLIVTFICANTDTATDQFSSVSQSGVTGFAEREQVFTADGNGGGIAIYTGSRATVGTPGSVDGTIAASATWASIVLAVAGYSAVGAEQASTFDIFDPVGAQQSATFDIFAAVAAERSSTFDEYALASTDQASIFDVAATAGADASSAFDVAAAVGAQQSATFDVAELVLAEQDSIFDLLQAAGAEQASTFDVLAIGAVGAEQASTFNVGGAVGVERSSTFDVATPVGASQASAHDVAGLAGSQAAAAFAVAGLAGADEDSSYTIAAAVGGDQASAFDLAGIAGAEADALFAMAGLAGAEQASTFDIRTDTVVHRRRIRQGRLTARRLGGRVTSRHGGQMDAAELTGSLEA